MLKRLMDPSSRAAKEVAEQKFIAGDLEGALKFAILSKKLDSHMEGIDEDVVAYQVHLAASKKSVTGETDWYKVLGVKSGFSDMENIKKNYNNLAAALLNRSRPAVDGAFRLIKQAWSKLSSDDQVELFSHKDVMCGNKVEKKACPRCKRWCKYETPKRCDHHVQRTKYDHKNPNSKTKTRTKNCLLVTCPSCRCQFDPKTSSTSNSRF
ncbi:DnaJ [Quillaja saponaria]|uniref:DnaJ n=1 Tax=Quillaja saponaria TaxID=32244 RepID=A0AAD7KZ97_QUISA|nr:DnaJ [Quillaja saponaria]